MKHACCPLALALLLTMQFACGDKAAETPASPNKGDAPSAEKAPPKNGTEVPAKKVDGDKPATAPSAQTTAKPSADPAQNQAAEAGDKSKSETAPAAQPPAADVPKPLVLGLERFGEVKAHAAFTLAATWTEAPKWGKASYLPKAELESMEPTVLQLSTSCGGECGPAKIAGNVKEALAGRVEGSKRPNQNTGDPALDAVRADVEVVHSMLSDGLAIQAIRINYSEELMKKGPYNPRFLVDCYAFRPTDDYYVQITASGPLASEPTHLPAILEMCKTLREVDADGAVASPSVPAAADANPAQPAAGNASGQPTPAAAAQPAAAAKSATWTDPVSGNVWQTLPPAEGMTWQQAQAYCSNLNLEGTGWKLPTITQLRSLIRGCPTAELGSECKVQEGGCLTRDCRKPCGQCPTGKSAAPAYWPLEVQGERGRYWSATEVQDAEGKVWVIDFGHAGLKVDSEDNQHKVRCVRAGK